MAGRGIAVLAAVVASAGLLAGPAGAAKRLVSETTFRAHPPLPGGEGLFILKDSPTDYLVSSSVVSKTAECRVRRTIALHAIHPDNTDTVIAFLKMKGISLFNFRIPLLPSDRIYASTPAKNLVTHLGRRVRCAAGQSAPQPVS